MLADRPHENFFHFKNRKPKFEPCLWPKAEVKLTSLPSTQGVQVGYGTAEFAGLVCVYVTGHMAWMAGQYLMVSLALSFSQSWRQLFGTE